MMNKRASIELWILGLVALIALVGLVLLLSGKLTGQAAGQPVVRNVIVTPEEFRVERPGGYSCGCDGVCAYSNEIVRASPTIDVKIANAEATCRKMLESICDGQPILRFNFGCGTR
ncbi:MAG: hypothetical protein QXT19_03835 [Candidatus Woesearchaeota archaeon]